MYIVLPLVSRHVEGILSRAESHDVSNLNQRSLTLDTGAIPIPTGRRKEAAAATEAASAVFEVPSSLRPTKTDFEGSLAGPVDQRTDLRIPDNGPLEAKTDVDGDRHDVFQESGSIGVKTDHDSASLLGESIDCIDAPENDDAQRDLGRGAGDETNAILKTGFYSTTKNFVLACQRIERAVPYACASENEP